MSERKHIFIDKDVWKRLHELKLEWEKQNISEVIKLLLERAEIGGIK